MDIVRNDSGGRTGQRPGFAPNGGDRDEFEAFHVEFDPQTESVDEVVVRAAAVIHNADPRDLDPLVDAVDPDALEDFFDSRPDDRAERSTITFTYEDLEVTVAGDGHVWLQWE